MMACIKSLSKHSCISTISHHMDLSFLIRCYITNTADTNFVMCTKNEYRWLLRRVVTLHMKQFLKYVPQSIDILHVVLSFVSQTAPDLVYICSIDTVYHKNAWWYACVLQVCNNEGSPEMCVGGWRYPSNLHWRWHCQWHTGITTIYVTTLC